MQIESLAKRIVLDLGLPLKNEHSANVPDSMGLGSANETLLHIFISHPHLDHNGVLETITQSVPVFMGDAAHKIIWNSTFFTPLSSLWLVYF